MKHGFIPAATSGAPQAAASLAPISISSLRPQPRNAAAIGGGDDGNPSSAAAHHAVLECRQGNNRFQFHISSLSAASAGASKALADLDSSPSAGHHHHAGFTIRVKRVLGDSHTFKE